MSLEPGKLRHRVRIEEYVDVLDSAGAPVRGPQGEFLKEWQEVATVWAAIEPLSAREFVQSQAVQSQVSARIIIRYRAGLDAAMRIVHIASGRIYNPAAFLADKDSGLEYLTAPVSEGVNEGQ
jgi:SPP1 family predicted phage head-tail adaptor